jgi:hypothetical protein
MPNLMCWEELRAGSTGDVVLAVDAPPRGPVAADFRELVPLLDTPHTIWLAIEQPARHPRDIDLETYVEPWVREVRVSGLKVRAVLGYGLGGIFAGVLAESIGALQGIDPEVLLVDPELVDTDTVQEEFLNLLNEVSVKFPEAEVETLERESTLALNACDGDAASLALRLCSAVERMNPATGADRVGSVSDMLGEALTLAASRLSALALADAADVIPIWSRSTALCSSSPDCGLNRTRAALLLPEACLVGRELDVAGKHTELLRSTAVASKVSEMLGVASG